MTIDELLALRASIPEDEDLPFTTTIAQQRAVALRRRDVDQRVLQARNAQASLDSLGDGAALTALLTFQQQTRTTLERELLALPPHSRDPQVRAMEHNLTLSIRCLDFGLQELDQTGYDVTTLRLGVLFIAAGYVPVGADPNRNYVGVIPWPGSLQEVQQRVGTHEQRRAQAQGALDEALLEDDARATREAEATEERKAFNALNARIAPDGNGLVVYDRDGEPIDITTLTPLQQKAFMKMDALHRKPEVISS